MRLYLRRKLMVVAASQSYWCLVGSCSSSSEQQQWQQQQWQQQQWQQRAALSLFVGERRKLMVVAASQSYWCFVGS
jgi:hypothetical protein